MPELHFTWSPALTVAFALFAGMTAQALARHLRVPGIALLLVAGAALGPDGLALVRPRSLGEGLPALVGCAVAVILFEGGMTLSLRRLKREARPIQQLISVGALVSLVVGALVAGLAMQFGWRLSLLFGTLVVVTGPTVVTPLLRQMKVKKVVSTVLEAEGVLIDAVGAITAAVALEIVLSPSGVAWGLALPQIAGRLLFGTVLGFVGGAVLALLLRVRGVIPEGLTNTFTLGGALLVFQLSNAVLHESGIAAVTVAGLVVGNADPAEHRSLHEFKEQLTTMLIALLFVLLVADVRVADVMALGWPGVVVVVLTIALVRPLSVLAGTAGTKLSVKQKAFIAWIGPRGIVAAAVASLFAYELGAAGIEGGEQLKALVFLVIAATVFWSALTGPIAARLLDLSRRSGDGWLVVGDNPVALQMAIALKEAGAEVVSVSADPTTVTDAEAEGLRALHRDPLDPDTLQATQLDTRLGAIATLERAEANYLFGEKSRLAVRTVRYPVAITSETHGVTEEMVRDFGGELLFGRAVEVEAWGKSWRRGELEVQRWRFRGRGRPAELLEAVADDALPLVHRRKRAVEPWTHRSRPRRGSELTMLVHTARAKEVAGQLEAGGWERASG